jgi:hypothetical protein
MIPVASLAPASQNSSAACSNYSTQLPFLRMIADHIEQVFFRVVLRRNVRTHPRPITGQTTHPPIFVGGGGKRLLTLAGREALTSEEILDSPHAFIGSINDLKHKFTDLRERFGISSFLIDDLETRHPWWRNSPDGDRARGAKTTFGITWFPSMSHRQVRLYRTSRDRRRSGGPRSETARRSLRRPRRRLRRVGV